MQINLLCFNPVEKLFKKELEQSRDLNIKLVEHFLKHGRKHEMEYSSG
jgi:hypothetical protein